MIDTSDLPLSVYDGSFTSQLILAFLYVRVILYYVLIFLAIIAGLIIAVSPIFIGYFGLKSIKNIMNDKTIYNSKKKSIKQNDRLNSYLYRLESSMAKK